MLRPPFPLVPVRRKKPVDRATVSSRRALASVSGSNAFSGPNISTRLSQYLMYLFAANYYGWWHAKVKQNESVHEKDARGTWGTWKQTKKAIKYSVFPRAWKELTSALKTSHLKNINLKLFVKSSGHLHSAVIKFCLSELAVFDTIWLNSSNFFSTNSDVSCGWTWP